MKKSIFTPGFSLSLSFCILLIGILSACSKKAEIAGEQLLEPNDKGVNKTSSLTTVVSYAKDVTPAASSIPMDQTKILLYSIPVTVQANDVVTVHLQQELTTTSTLHQMTAAYIIASTSPTGTATTGGTCVGILSKPSGSNLAPNQEGNAEIITRTGSHKFAAGGTFYINAVFYAAKLTTAVPPPLQVPSGAFGEMVVAVERGVDYYESTSYASGLPYDSGFGKYYPPSSPTLAVQYSLPISIAAGKQVDVRYQAEVTSEAASSATPHIWGKSVIAGTSATATSGTQLLKPNEVTTPRHYEHHFTASYAGGWFFTTATNTFLNAVVYAKNVTSPDRLYLEPHNYGHFKVEVRPLNGYWKDPTRNISTVNNSGAGQVLYSIGPIDLKAGDLVEVRYHSVFTTSAPTTQFTSKIVRGTNNLSTSGVLVQPHLWRRFNSQYGYSTAIHTTAERITADIDDQCYNVVVAVPGGGSLGVQDWGQLEVVIR